MNRRFLLSLYLVDILLTEELSQCALADTVAVWLAWVCCKINIFLQRVDFQYRVVIVYHCFKRIDCRYCGICYRKLFFLKANLKKIRSFIFLQSLFYYCCSLLLFIICFKKNIVGFLSFCWILFILLKNFFVKDTYKSW